MAGAPGGFDEHGRGLLPRRLVPEMLIVTGFIALIWGGVALMCWQARQTAIEAARQQTVSLTRAYAESSARIATLLDRHLLALRAAFAEKGEAFSLTDWVVSQSSPDPMTAQISIADASGLITQTTGQVSDHPVSIADRAHFRAHLGDGPDGLFISAPVTGRVSGVWSVQFSRKLVDGDGDFAGVGVISLSCDDLSRFFETGGGVVMLAGLDGIVRGHGPHDTRLLGFDLHAAKGFAALLSGDEEGTIEGFAPWDNVWRIMSFRRVAHYPLVVLAGYDESRIFRQYTPMRDRAIGIGIAASLIILLLGFVWVRSGRHFAASRRALLVTLDHMNQGIMMVDQDGCVPVVNRRAVELLDLPPSLLASHRTMRGAEADSLGLPSLSGDGGDVIHRDGRIIESVSQPLPGGGLVRTFTDVTERRIADARIRHMAHHDALTGLANRVFLNERMAEPLKRSAVAPFGLICFDLDGFKTVNDTMGHDAGDRLLVDVARRLLGVLEDGALLARIGGDEFAVLCLGETQPEMTERTAAAILAVMAEPLELDGTQFRLSASLGLAFHPEDGTTPATLLKHADTAMYQAKARGRGALVRYDPAMDRARRERSLIERDLRQALRDQTLEVWFQPRFETQPSRISGFEALVRWRHPERGFISPAVFVPIAEQCGLIADLGQFVLRDAAAFAASLPHGRIAVNLSPVQFMANNLPDLISEVLAAHHLTPDRMELEVTEGVLIADEAQALAVLSRLHDLGLQLALDDFGTGYASLSYLRRFPFDRIKIDQSFVQAQEHDATTRAIVESIMIMAQRLRLEVTAEGVETERQLALLVSQGCPELQGYYLGRPMPAWEARAFHAGHQAPRGVTRSAFDLTAA